MGCGVLVEVRNPERLEQLCGVGEGTDRWLAVNPRGYTATNQEHGKGR